MAAMPQRMILADIFTLSHRIVGKIQVPNTGVIGKLNDTTSIMEVREANLARLDEPKKLVDRYRVMRVVKDRLFAVSLSREDDIGPMAWARGGYGAQYDYPVRLVSPVFEIAGVFRWSERFDLHAIMVEGTRDFMPIFEAELNTVLSEGFTMDCPALVFNRKQIDALALLQGTGELQGE